MTLDYTACHFEVTPLQPASDLLIAELGSLGFESFEETPTGVIAYINTSFWSPDLLEGLDVYDFDGFLFHTPQRKFLKKIGMPIGRLIFLPFR